MSAFSAGNAELVPELKGGANSFKNRKRWRWTNLGNILVVCQITMTMLVLVGAGLLTRTLMNLKAVDLGFDPKNLLLFATDTTYSDRSGESLNRLYSELREQIAALPGVISVTHLIGPPFYGVDGEDHSLWEPSIFENDPSSTPIRVHQSNVGPDFFRTMRIPLLAGYAFHAEDFVEGLPSKASDLKPVVINEKLAHILFGNQPAIGKSFRMRGTPAVTAALSTRREVVGVVGDARDDSLRGSIKPTIYLPVGTYSGGFEIRTAGDPKASLSTIRMAVSRLDNNLMITSVRTQLEQIDQNLYQVRLVANLSSLFALLALVVACIGIYGLLSYQVSRRTQEIGIRMALGGRRGNILRLVMRQGAVLIVLGSLIGVTSALAVTRYLQSFLFGVKPSDPLTIASVTFVLVALGLLYPSTTRNED